MIDNVYVFLFIIILFSSFLKGGVLCKYNKNYLTTNEKKERKKNVECFFLMTMV